MTPVDFKLASGLAADGRSLDALKRTAARDPQAAVKQAAQQFEALFMQMVLKSMREAMPKSGLLDSSAQDMYAGMLDQQMAQKVAGSGTGLAAVIARQLTRHMAPLDHRAEPAADPFAGRPATLATSRTVTPAVTPAVTRTVTPTVTPSDEPSALQSATAPAVRLPAAVDRYAEMARVDTPRVDRYAQIDRPSAAAAAARERYLNRFNPQALSARAPGADEVAAAAGSADVSAGSARVAQRDFVTRHWDHALAAQRATGIPARFIVGQAALESGWGQQEIRTAAGLPSHNLFGIKATGGWQGRTVNVVTTEYDNGAARQVVEKFRAYNNYSEAFRDWAQLLAGNPRYAQVLQQGADAQGFAFGLQRAGYATDPRYGEKLARLIDSVAALQARG